MSSDYKTSTTEPSTSSATLPANTKDQGSKEPVDPISIRQRANTPWENGSKKEVSYKTYETACVLLEGGVYSYRDIKEILIDLEEMNEINRKMMLPLGE